MAYLLLDVRGHGQVPDEKVAEVRAAVQRIVDVTTAAGFPLRVDCVATHPDTLPEVTGVVPLQAVCGGPDVTLHVSGTGFSSMSVILFNGGEEVTTYVSATELTTLVKPSLSTVASTVPVSVVGASTSVPFAFTLPETRSTTPAPPHRPKP